MNSNDSPHIHFHCLGELVNPTLPMLGTFITIKHEAGFQDTLRLQLTQQIMQTQTLRRSYYSKQQSFSCIHQMAPICTPIQ